tara:strand:- start:161 stop:787 length:627 start_codon:yes stop_codon:yes gene_type:complete
MQDDTKLKTTKRRGRPRSYDPEQALQQAMDSCWSGGYSATSLDDLSTATGMNRPSLYAAFGNKRSIYLQAMDKFGMHMAGQLEPVLTADQPLEAALRAFYGRVLNVYFSGDDGPRGCMVMCTATSEAHADPQIRQYLDRTLQRIDAMLTSRFERALADGELPPDADPTMLGKLAATTMHSLALRSRAGQSRASLKRLSDASARMLARA